jgi:hypothetical protein
MAPWAKTMAAPTPPPGEKQKLMNEAKILSQEAINQLLAVADGLPHGPTLDELLVQLRAAPLAAVFILSRKAQSSEVRSEAAKIVNARLHEDNNGPEPPAFDAVSEGEPPPKLATHRHFYKVCEDQRWVLTTRNGIRVGTFPSEAELDRWWLGLKKQRGRILTRKRRGMPPGSELLPQPPGGSKVEPSPDLLRP